MPIETKVTICHNTRMLLVTPPLTWRNNTASGGAIRLQAALRSRLMRYCAASTCLYAIARQRGWRRELNVPTSRLLLVTTSYLIYARRTSVIIPYAARSLTRQCFTVDDATPVRLVGYYAGELHYHEALLYWPERRSSYGYIIDYSSYC